MRPLPLQPGASGGTYIPPEDTFEVKTAAPAVRFLTQAVQPPSIVYVEADDVLQCNAATSATGETVTVTYRLLKANGEIVPGQFNLSPTNNRAVSIHTEQLTEGFLLSMSCRAATAQTRGQTFVRLFLTGPDLGVSQPSYMLMSDYVTTAMAPGHPNGRILAPTEGPGQIRIVSVANPLAGQDWSVAVPTNAIWRVISLYAQLLADVNVATRIPLLKVSLLGNFVWSVPPTQGLTASAGSTYSAASVSAVPLAGVNAWTWTLPPALLLRGALSGGLLTSTSSIQVGDQWSAIDLLVEEWLENV